jgi:hypothetical protein
VPSASGGQDAATLTKGEPAAAPSADLRTFITVSRKHESDVRQRQIIVRLDSDRAVTLYYGDAFTREIAPGTHRLHVHNTLFWKRIKFQIEAGEHLEFVTINRAGPGTLSFLALVGAAPLFLTVERRSLS